MPAMIPTPWIKAYDPAQEFLSGHAQGVQIAEANARLQQSQQHAAMQAELEKQRIEQQSRIESQRIEVTKAYHDAEIGMQQQRLAEEKKVNDWKIQQAAQKSLIMLQARHRIQDLGEDPVKVWKELGPEMGFTGTGMASIEKMEQAKVPPTLNVKQIGGDTYYQSGTSHWMYKPQIRQPPAGTLTQQQRSQVTAIRDDIKRLQASLPDNILTAMSKTEEEIAKVEKGDPQAAINYRTRKAAGLKIQAEIDALKKQRDTILGSARSGGYMQAPPASERKAGETYLTPKGPYTWTGSGWMTPDTDEEFIQEQDEEEPNVPEE